MSETPNGCTHNCSSCPHSGSCGSQKKTSFLEPGNSQSHVKKIIGVVSGKGGVGKSMVTGSLAVLMNRQGSRTAILDADITGPSIPKMFGITGRAEGDENGILPRLSPEGIKVMSVNLLLENPENPVVWRGPIIAGTVKQFWTDVIWGDVDYMFVDMPPGTGDVPLTVFQSIPLDGILIITSPQELVSMIVGKAVNMAKKMNIPILGLIENMSYVQCPDCGKHIHVFGESHLEDVAAAYGLDVLGRLPIDPAIASACDQGRIEEVEGDWLDGAADLLEHLGD